MKFEDIEIRRFGTDIHPAGSIYQSSDGLFYLYFPDWSGVDHFKSLSHFLLTAEDWTKLFQQLDVVETEIMTKDSKGELIKKVVRKSQRQISQHIMWQCFRRDSFKCCYCGADDVPMTVDHLILWEEGGPTIPENLLTCCKQCNHNRGNLQFADWLSSDYYGRRSTKLDLDRRAANVGLVSNLSAIPRFQNSKGKR